MPKVGRVSVPYTALAHSYGCHHTPAQLLSAPNTLKTKENHTPNRPTRRRRPKPRQRNSTPLPKPPFPLPNLAFRSG